MGRISVALFPTVAHLADLQNTGGGNDRGGWSAAFKPAGGATDVESGYFRRGSAGGQRWEVGRIAMAWGMRYACNVDMAASASIAVFLKEKGRGKFDGSA